MCTVCFKGAFVHSTVVYDIISEQWGLSTHRHHSFPTYHSCAAPLTWVLSCVTSTKHVVKQALFGGELQSRAMLLSKSRSSFLWFVRRITISHCCIRKINIHNVIPQPQTTHQTPVSSHRPQHRPHCQNVCGVKLWHAAEDFEAAWTDLLVYDRKGTWPLTRWRVALATLTAGCSHVFPTSHRSLAA